MNILDLFSRGRDLERIIKTANRLRGDIDMAIEAGLDGKFKKLVKADPSLKPLQNIYNRSQRLVDRVQDFVD